MLHVLFYVAAAGSFEAVTDAGPVTLTFDSSPRDGSAGVLLGFVGGPEARELAALPAGERRAPVLACLERLFGARAAQPLDYAEQTWQEEEWSGGGPTSNFGPGGWTSCGPFLREPSGRVHWAGTETATVWSGYMEGALQAGERAASEVLRLSGAVARVRGKTGWSCGFRSAMVALLPSPTRTELPAWRTK